MYGPNLTHLASRTTFASGYFELTREQPHRLDPRRAVAHPDGVGGVPARAPGTPGVTCVGMPSFTEDTPEGQPVMTRAEAETLADYLLGAEVMPEARSA